MGDQASEQTAEQMMRAKRLAKLGGSPVTLNKSEETIERIEKSPSPSPSPIIQKTTSTPEKPQNQPSPQPKIESNIQPMEVDTVQKVSIKSNWEHDLIQQTFQVSLQPTSNPNTCFLSELAEEMKNENLPLTFNKDLIDRIVVARLSVPASSREEKSSHFDYLYECYSRAYQEERRTSSFKNTEQKLEVLRQIKNFCISYSGLVIQMPEMFATETGLQGTTLLANRVLNESLSLEFLTDFIERFKEDELPQMFNPVLLALSNQMRTQTLTSDYSRPFWVFVQLSSFKPIGSLITSLPSFLPKNVSAREFEVLSFLGPFLRLSPFIEDDPKFADQHFSNAIQRSVQDITSTQATIRSALHNIHNGLHTAVKSTLTAGTDVREKVIQYFAEAVNKNEKRAQMQVDRLQVSTDGFMFNCISIFIKLCEPFVKQPEKMKLIDSEYFLKSSRINVSKATKLRALQEDIESWQKENLTEEIKNNYSPNFVTECFFLTALFLHLGLTKTFSKYTAFLKEFRDLQKAQKRIKEAPPSPQTELLLQRIQNQIELYVKAKFCFDILLLDAELMSSVFQYYSFMCQWMINLANPQNQPLPLSSEPSFVFKSLPEFFVEDILEFFLFLSRYAPELLHSNPLDPILNFIVIFMSQPDYIKSPHLRSKFPEFLYMITPEIQAQSRSPSLEYLFYTNPIVLKHLTKALMDFYQEVENTGSSHQFYEKFNVRYHISMLLKLLWGNPVHQSNVVELSKNTDYFVRFVNLLLNDTTYLLGESLPLLGEIHKVQEKKKDINAWNALTEEERKEIESNHTTNERRCQSLLFLAKETLNMLRYMSSVIVTPFLRPQILDRLVAMLNYNVVQLVGPKCQELKVQNPEKYGFNPKELLSILLDIFIHLKEPEFIEAMAKEGRSYDRSHFDKAVSIFRRFGLKNEDEIQKIENLIEQVESRLKAMNEEEEELGDIPDEFLDPITYTLMEDPVLLPTSNTIVDRSTIETHLLSDVVDPFNRQPLTMQMVVEATEMKERIQQFLKNKRKRED